jgi:putative phosphoserine phosphatase/1-acylglycerol-3-phosphate O-acyltransferase
MAGLPIWALTGSQREARNFATSLFADVSSALIGLNLVVRGEENLWSRRPAVFVFNHQSKADVVIIARLLRRDIAGVGKKEIKKMPLIGKTLELAGTVFIDRENAASAIDAMQPLVDAMRNEGKSVVIAPEGTRTISPRLAPFKKGAFHLAIQAGVPMVPIVIHNAGDVAPKGDFVFRPATVEVDVLPPVDTSGWREETIERHVADIRRMFQATLGQEEERSGPAPVAEPVSQAQFPVTPEAGPKQARRRKKPRKKAAAAPAPAVELRESAETTGTRESQTPAAGKTVLKKKALKKKALRKKKQKVSAAPKKKAARKPPRKKPTRKKVLAKKPLTGEAGA